MGRELGRISGPLLSENLLRNGSNLVFDSNLLSLSVGNRRIGINTIAPTRDLLVPLEINTTNLLVDNLSEIANFTISTNQIQDPISTITISPSQTNPLVTAPGVTTSLLEFTDRFLYNSTANSNINFNPSGTGISNIKNDTLVNGNLHATGSITWDGDIQFGSDSTDTVTIKADINSDIVPNLTETYDFGSSSLTWKNLYVKTTNASTINGDLVVVSVFNVGDLIFENNTIRNSNPANNINLITDTTQLVEFNNIAYVYDNNEIPTMGEFVLNGTANGYTKVAGTFGVVIPTGESTDTVNSQTGMLRFNTDLGYVTVYNGATWQPVGGISEVLTQDEVTDVMWAWDLILG